MLLDVERCIQNRQSYIKLEVMPKLFFTFTACNRFRETTTTSTTLYKNFMVWESFFTLADPFPTSIKSSHTTAKSARKVANTRGGEQLSHYSPKGDNTSRLRSLHATATERWLITFPKLITAKILSTTRPVTDVAVHHANGTRILHLRAAGLAGNDIFLTILLRKFAIPTSRPAFARPFVWLITKMFIRYQPTGLVRNGRPCDRAALRRNENYFPKYFHPVPKTVASTGTITIYEPGVT